MSLPVPGSNVSNKVRRAGKFPWQQIASTYGLALRSERSRSGFPNLFGSTFDPTKFVTLRHFRTSYFNSSLGFQRGQSRTKAAPALFKFAAQAEHALLEVPYNQYRRRRSITLNLETLRHRPWFAVRGLAPRCAARSARPDSNIDFDFRLGFSYNKS